MMKIRYRVDEVDFVAASELARRSSSVFPKARLLAAIVCCGSLAVMYATWAPDWRNPVVLFILLCAAMSLFTPYLVRFFNRRAYRKAAIMHGLHTLDVDSSGLHFTNDHSEAKVSWDAYEKLVESDRILALKLKGLAQYVPIPKRDLSPQEVSELRSLISLHLSVQLK